MYISCRVALTIVASFSMCGWSCHAETRYALLIANSAYPKAIGPLVHPPQDVDILEQSLRELGFKVTKLRDVGFKDFNRAVMAHIGRVRRENNNEPVLSLIYYSGHGAADMATKVNYLIPVDVTEATTSSLWGESINLQSNVINALKDQAPNANHFVVIDACRNELELKDGNKPVTVAGKAFIPVSYTSGMLIAFTTQENKTTPDNGIYAKILAKNIMNEKEIVVVFRDVQLEMQKLTGQSPFAVASNLPSIYFKLPSERPQSPPQMIGPVTPSSKPVLANNACPEITFTDYSVFPAVSKIERRCVN